MRLAVFITANIDSILLDWIAFAAQQFPAAHGLDKVNLLDHGRTLLEEIVSNMARPEGEAERRAKSEGNSQEASESSSVPSRSHARQRERQGFKIGQMVAEYRALRATVLRRWQAAAPDFKDQDLEDMVRFNEALDQALAESVEVFAREVDRARDLFLGMMGHDLRGPLSSIASCAAVELRKWPDDVRYAPLTLRSVAQMKALLNDLMEFTTYRLGKGLSLVTAPLQLDQFARNTLDEINAVYAERALELVSLGDMQGRWDGRRLHQALSNLVFNALKYGHSSAPVHIVLDGSSPHAVLLTVRNTGKPIAPHLLPRLFDPLVREEQDEDSDARDASDDDRGATAPLVSGANLGLGLFVVREIAQAHGGSVEVFAEGETTEFRLRLPRVCSVPTGPSPAQPAPADRA